MLCESRVNVSHGSAWVRAPGELIPLGSKGSRVGRCYFFTVFFLHALFFLALFSTRTSPRHPVRLPALLSAPLQTAPVGHRVERVDSAYLSASCSAHGRFATSYAASRWTVVAMVLACACTQRPIVTLWRTIHMTGPRGSAVRVGFARLKRKPHWQGGERSPDKLLVGLEL